MKPGNWPTVGASKADRWLGTYVDRQAGGWVGARQVAEYTTFKQVKLKLIPCDFLFSVTESSGLEENQNQSSPARSVQANIRRLRRMLADGI